ncbi:hypothetical protein C1Y40_05733 [Mycobacterium talmoniae]|uniref:6-phosphogluconate dehydrogenase NADP-binding domain-containing protein n=1 Tax=Mycobacterium talmoniae TaxID=1858794 RepID=A0A2S8BBR9_9MYCO|nr:hypothetical protein C1Y40_05733 [Mycobacterium talmoniae]
MVGDADVEEVVTGDNGVLAGLAAGGVIAVHSTVHPNTCRQLAVTAARRTFRCSTPRSAAVARRPPPAGCW